MPRAIGIDLGTTYSCVAVFHHGNVKIIANEQGNRITSSYVAFTDNERLIGDLATSQPARNLTNTIFGVQRLIGCKYDDPTVQADMKYWPFKILNDNGKPKVLVQYKDRMILFTPEEICSMVLAKMKQIAEVYCNKKISEAVITVPSYFNYSQRQVIKDAAIIAGLNVLYIVNASTAAALAYGFDKKVSVEQNVLVFDLGAGTLNVSILTIEEGIFEVKSIAGNTHLGGEDFDNRIVTHFVQEFKQKYDKDLSENKRALQRLRIACQSAKHTLSLLSEVPIEIDSLYDGINFHSTITRTCFEEICDDLFRSTLKPVEKSLRDAKMNKSLIHEIILVGGSTRIPKIQKLLQEFFNAKELNKSLNADEAAAYGAAILAAIRTGDQSDAIKDVLLLDVVPHTLGIETTGGTMTAVIKRNTTIPTKQTQTFTTSIDNQHTFGVKIYEGKRSMTNDNHLLGSFELSGIPPAPHGVPQIEVTFDIDGIGTLNVSAIDKSLGRENKITVTNDHARLSKDEIERMIRDAERFRKEDEIECSRLQTKNSLESYCFYMKTTINDGELRDKIDVDDKNKIINTIEYTLEWMERNQLAEKEEFEKKLKEVEKICLSVITKLYGAMSRKFSDRLYSGADDLTDPPIEEVD
ncbi:unnamed protein product [Rotaria sp. Silwood1]|nr:unnamed protein product [Rotaria sp. Silwood1]CAF4805267.1 unnamed protein product [Rotaria sp. Silwood1]